MSKRQQTGWTFVLGAVVFVILGSSTDAVSPVLRYLMAGACAVVGFQLLRTGGSAGSRRPDRRGERAS